MGEEPAGQGDAQNDGGAKDRWIEDCVGQEGGEEFHGLIIDLMGALRYRVCP